MNRSIQYRYRSIQYPFTVLCIMLLNKHTNTVLSILIACVIRLLFIVILFFMYFLFIIRFFLFFSFPGNAILQHTQKFSLILL